MTRPLRVLCALAAIFAALCLSVAQAAGPDDVLLPVPQRSQIDGTVWGPSNCGPASLAMALEAFGDKVPTVDLRKRANQLLGVSSPDTGTKIEHLAKIAEEQGFAVSGPMDGKKYRRWSVDQARAELRAGNPLLVQVYFPLLPNQRKNPVVTDHFVVLVGTSGSDFIFNDPADTKAAGYRQRMTEAELAKTWGASGAPYAAFSVAPGSKGASLLPPPPPTPTPPPAAASVATVQPEPQATPAPIATVQAPSPIAIVETPADESVSPDQLPREATGGEEIKKSDGLTASVSAHHVPLAIVALLIVATQARATWSRKAPRG